MDQIEHQSENFAHFQFRNKSLLLTPKCIYWNKEVFQKESEDGQDDAKYGPNLNKLPGKL